MKAILTFLRTFYNGNTESIFFSKLIYSLLILYKQAFFLNEFLLKKI